MSGSVSISAPVAVNAAYLGDEPIGMAYFGDASTSNDTVGYVRAVGSADTITMAVMDSSTTYVNVSSVSATVPITFTTTDTIVFNAPYEAD